MINAREYAAGRDFEITGVSYVGAPRRNTAMFATAKVAYLLAALDGCENCLVFVEQDMQAPPALAAKHAFVPCADPEREYGQLTERLWQAEEAAEAEMVYTAMPGGWLLGQGAQVEAGAVIQPYVLIGHGVRVGAGTRVEAGTHIYHADIGAGCVIKGNSVIGGQAYFHYTAEDENIRHLYQLGQVVVEDHVEIGACTTVNRAVADVTRLRQYAMLDDMVHVAHDCDIGQNARLMSGVVLGGFCTIGERATVSMNATLRNRISVGRGSMVGMGSVVTKPVPEGVTVYGNPARPKLSQ